MSTRWAIPRVDVVKLPDPVLTREIARGLLVGRVFLGFRGGDVIEHDRQAFRIVQLVAPIRFMTLTERQVAV